ncbi:MAG: ABC transporter ATP-binding protein [Actinobacteria bacterium]|nr:ABC transporter ATP-binding protein [Actinomycetota bacterium]
MFGMGAGVAPEDQLDRSQTRRVLGRVLRMAYPFRHTAYVALGCVVVTTAATLAAPILVRHGIDAGIRADNIFELNLSVGLYLAITALAYGFGRLQYVFLNRTGEAFLRELRLKVFAAMQRQSMAFYDRNKAGVLVARMTADIETMGELIQWGLLQFLASGFLVVLAFVVLFSLSWQLTLVVLIVFPVIVIASVKFQRDSNIAYLSVRERVGQNLGTLQEGIAAVRVIQAYAQEDHQIKRFERSNRSLFDSHVRSIRISTWYFGLVEFSGVVAASLVVGIGGWLVHRDTVSLGTVVAFILLLSSLFDPVQQLSQLYNGVQSAAAALHKLYGILDHKPEIDEAPDAVNLPTRGVLTVSDVTFTYQAGTQPALQSAELVVADGERIALVGPTGAGKSTLAKLMARLYDPSQGSVSYGGVDLRRATLASLRQRIVVVPQEGFLFNGTIRDNVRLARVTASDAEVEAALSRLGILDHFERLPEGLDTEVRERGSRLSAGERQLVALGRAALVDPAVLVLDEATSNLDPGTEAEVEAALERLMQGRTTIVVVDKARIVEVGSHVELLAHGGKYAALARAWEKSHAL